MIPEALSGEANQDSEPFLAVSATNGDWMAASAFTPDPGGAASPTAPIFVSQDAGASWTLNSIVPSPVQTADITHAFHGNVLYASILRTTDGQLLELISNDFVSSNLMTAQASRPDDDQPFVRATGSGGKTYIYIGNNDTSQSTSSGKTATVDVSSDGGVTYKVVRLESRQSADISSCTRGAANQDGPSVRPAVARDGVVYVSYFGWRTFTGNCGKAQVIADVVIARDDGWGNGPMPFQELKDQADHASGKRVVSNVSIQWSNDETLGHERVGSTLALAVDPANSQRVFVSWADGGTEGAPYTVHVRNSTDKGVTWSERDLVTRPYSTNAALAVADNGTVALLYQELVTADQGHRWRTHLLQTRDNFATSQDTVLSDTPADKPDPQFLPYLGDYVGLQALGAEFRGVFSANNYPDRSDFPHGVTYQRRADFSSKKLLDGRGREVPVSIDPFYFSVAVKQ